MDESLPQKSLLSSTYIWKNNEATPAPRNMRRNWDMDKLNHLRYAGINTRCHNSRPRGPRRTESRVLDSVQFKELLDEKSSLDHSVRIDGRQLKERRELEERRESEDVPLERITPQLKRLNYGKFDDRKNSSQITDLLTHHPSLDVPLTKIHNLNDSRIMKEVMKPIDDDPANLDDEMLRSNKWRTDCPKPIRELPHFVIALNPLKSGVDVLATPLSPPRLRKRTDEMNPDVVQETGHLEVSIISSIKYLI